MEQTPLKLFAENHEPEMMTKLANEINQNLYLKSLAKVDPETFAVTVLYDADNPM